MIQIEVTRVIPDPKPREWQDEHTFESGDEVWTLVLHDPFEWHMGAYGWQAKLLRDDSDVSAAHQILTSLGAGKGFHLPSNYAPWCHDNLVLVLHPWGSVLHLYDVGNRKSVSRELGHFPLGIQWAPVGKLLAVTCDGRVQILDTSAEDVASINIRHPKFEDPAVFWWRDGKRILIIGRTSQRARTQLSVCDSASGQLLGITRFDPAELLPYDQAAYSRIGRHRYSLNVGRGTRCVGYLLDTWSRLEFDVDQCLLRGTVYRPDGPCEQKEGAYTCVASERSIEVIVRA